MKKTAIMLFFLTFALPSQERHFEVASVKPSPKDNGMHPTVNGPSSLSLHGLTLRLLVAMAYDVPPEQVVGGPSWMDSSIYDIEATTSSPTTRDEKMEMLRALINERFSVRLHFADKTISAYALVVAKDGPKIRPASPDSPAPQRREGFVASRISMKQLATIVAAYLKIEFPSAGQPPLTPPDPLPVIDKTGLSGQYDVVLDLTRDRDWFVVLEKQLGLQLRPEKLPVSAIIIDAALPPTAN